MSISLKRDLSREQSAEFPSVDFMPDVDTLSTLSMASPVVYYGRGIRGPEFCSVEIPPDPSHMVSTMEYPSVEAVRVGSIVHQNRREVFKKLAK